MAESHYCPMCGIPHGGIDPVTEPAADVEVAAELSRADVEIERIRADKEIRLAKIAAGVLDVEREAELAHAEGKAEGVTETLETLSPDPEPAPVIVDAPVDPEPELVPDVPAPPVDVDHQDHDEPKHKRSSHGMSSGWFG